MYDFALDKERRMTFPFYLATVVVDIVTTRTMTSLPSDRISTENLLGEKNPRHDIPSSCDAGLLSEVATELGVVDVDVDRQKANPRAMGQRDTCPWHCISVIGI